MSSSSSSCVTNVSVFKSVKSEKINDFTTIVYSSNNSGFCVHGFDRISVSEIDKRMTITSHIISCVMMAIFDMHYNSDSSAEEVYFRNNGKTIDVITRLFKCVDSDTEVYAGPAVFFALLKSYNFDDEIIANNFFAAFNVVFKWLTMHSLFSNLATEYSDPIIKRKVQQFLYALLTFMHAFSIVQDYVNMQGTEFSIDSFKDVYTNSHMHASLTCLRPSTNEEYDFMLNKFKEYFMQYFNFHYSKKSSIDPLLVWVTNSSQQIEHNYSSDYDKMSELNLKSSTHSFEDIVNNESMRSDSVFSSPNLKFLKHELQAGQHIVIRRVSDVKNVNCYCYRRICNDSYTVIYEFTNDGNVQYIFKDICLDIDAYDFNSHDFIIEVNSDARHICSIRC